MLPKSQSWGRQERRGGTGGAVPQWDGAGWVGGNRGFGAERSNCLQPWVCCSWSQRSQRSHVQPCPAVPGACRNIQVDPGDLGMEQGPRGRCCSPSPAFGDTKGDLQEPLGVWPWTPIHGVPLCQGPWCRQGCEGQGCSRNSGEEQKRSAPFAA